MVANRRKQAIDDVVPHPHSAPWPQSFSFAPGEDPSAEKLTSLVVAFAKEFGFAENQMPAFKHNDTKHKHIHIVANRINYNARNTADHFKNYAWTGEFSRRMELELGLTITSDMSLGKQMQTHGFNTYIGRGVAFFNRQNRMKVKGYDLGKDYSLQNLEQRMGMEMSQAFVPVKRKKKSRRRRQGLSI
jgi:hypothetical protein